MALRLSLLASIHASWAACLSCSETRGMGLHQHKGELEYCRGRASLRCLADQMQFVIGLGQGKQGMLAFA